MAKQAVRAAYQHPAERYGFTTQLYRLLGFRIDAYRRHALALLNPDQATVSSNSAVEPD